MFKFPFTNFHELNLDWILSVVKTAQEIFETGRTDIDYAVTTADEAKEIATQAAESTIPDNSVSTVKLQDGAVTHSKLGVDAVESNNIKNGAITNVDIADNAITNVKIASSTITPDKLNTSAHYESLTSLIQSTLFIGSRTIDTIHKIAFVSFTVESDSNIPTNTPITKVPDYYPQFNYGIPALIVLADNSFRAGNVVINSEGNIVQNFATTVRKIFVCGFYPYA